jgi:hypothetical protein
MGDHRRAGGDRLLPPDAESKAKMIFAEENDKATA